MLKFVEVVQQRGAVIGKLEYVYHYQDRYDRLIFRYDNVPHHPDVVTFPHHKHVILSEKRAEGIEPATAPQLSDVLREIEHNLYSDIP